MGIYTGLLFQHGHIADVALARSLAESAAQQRDKDDADAMRQRLREKRAQRNRALRRLALRGSTALSLFR